MYKEENSGQCMSESTLFIYTSVTTYVATETPEN